MFGSQLQLIAGIADVVVVGRLRQGLTQEAAQAEMDVVMQGIGREHIQDSKPECL